MTNPTTLPTTTVQAYVATDGSLWLNEDECLEKNRLLKDHKLYSHINNRCSCANSQTADTTDILEYIRMYFDEIKSILGK